MAGEIILNCLAKAKRDGGDEGTTLYIKFFGEGVPGEKRIRKVGKLKCVRLPNSHRRLR
jgi:hypothetical protein